MADLPLYCGNNSAAQPLLAGTSQIGTRYGCLKRGVGRGLHMPTDLNYLGDFQPIDDRKFYCGNRDNLPVGYDGFATLSQCMQKGVGIGRSLKAKREAGIDGAGGTSISVSFLHVLIAVGVTTAIIALLLAALKPTLVLKKTEPLVDWWRVVALSLVASLIMTVLEFVIAKLILNSM